MTDLMVLAVGLGVMPLAAFLLLSFREWIEARRDAAWGGLAGVIAFLGLSHAMGFVLGNKPLLSGAFGEAGTTLFLFTGLAMGAVIGWFVLEGPIRLVEPSRIVWAAAAFLALHSFGDGLVLGRDFVGAAFPSVQVDSLTISASIVHRFVEGAIVLVPAIAASWRQRSSFGVLLLSLASIPAAYLPGWLSETMGLSNGTVTVIALATFLAAIEATLALLILVRAFLPIASAGRGTRGLLWTAVGFIGISLIHFLAE